MQTLEQKARAIASVLWLMEDHYRMIAAGRLGSCIQYVRQLDGSERWRPPILEDFEDWPVNHVLAWLRTQRKTSARYRLWAIGLALQKLEKLEPKQAAAVKACYIEIPPPFDWYDNLQALADDGLMFMAGDVPGDVPEWGGVRPKPKKEQIADAVGEGLTTSEIAYRVGCSGQYVRRIKATLAVRQECTLSAVGVDS